jgi:hypothetical protein
VAGLTIMTEARGTGNTSTVQKVGRRCRLIGAREALPTAVSLVSASVRPAAIGIKHVCLWRRGGIRGAGSVMLF